MKTFIKKIMKHLWLIQSLPVKNWEKNTAEFYAMFTKKSEI